MLICLSLTAILSLLAATPILAGEAHHKPSNHSPDKLALVRRGNTNSLGVYICTGEEWSGKCYWVSSHVQPLVLFLPHGVVVVMWMKCICLLLISLSIHKMNLSLTQHDRKMQRPGTATNNDLAQVRASAQTKT